MSIISVSNLSKAYRIGKKAERADSFVGMLQDSVTAPFRNWRRMRQPTVESRNTSDELHWALRDVSFEVKEGEVLGVIGRNGAGKSTLLKILSRITEPTSGEVRIRGRVASLLEVGTGFHPELTGRENVYLNGTILGMHKSEIDRNFDEIVNFSGVEAFLDTPVKRYSSGMKVRLAFAVAAHLDPEILIIDEVLAVGDAEFQKRCMGKMGSVANSGRTVLFVSHNMIAVRTLCKRVVSIAAGRVIFEGDAGTAVTQYLCESITHLGKRIWEKKEAAPGDDTIRIHSIRVNPSKNKDGTRITLEDEIEIETAFWTIATDRNAHITFHLINHEGITVLTTACQSSTREVGLYYSRFAIPGGLLNSGTYILTLLIVHNENNASKTLDSIATFTVIEDTARKTACTGREPSVIVPHLKWEEWT